MQTDEKILIADIRSKLSDYRFNHSLCVAESAKELALKYGANVQKAYLTGLMHDVLKEQKTDEALAYFESHGVELTPLERGAEKLWHALSGAIYAGEIYGFDAEMTDAIRYHTTGRENMTLLERVLFIADFISADRDYNGVEDMRERAKVSLEYAMTEGLRFTIEDLARGCKPIHPDTLACYNDILINGRNSNNG